MGLLNIGAKAATGDVAGATADAVSGGTKALGKALGIGTPSSGGMEEAIMEKAGWPALSREQANSELGSWFDLTFPLWERAGNPSFNKRFFRNPKWPNLVCMIVGKTRPTEELVKDYVNLGLAYQADMATESYCILIQPDTDHGGGPMSIYMEAEDLLLAVQNNQVKWQRGSNPLGNSDATAQVADSTAPKQTDKAKADRAAGKSPSVTQGSSAGGFYSASKANALAQTAFVAVAKSRGLTGEGLRTGQLPAGNEAERVWNNSQYIPSMPGATPTATEQSAMDKAIFEGVNAGLRAVGLAPVAAGAKVSVGGKLQPNYGARGATIETSPGVVEVAKPGAAGFMQSLNAGGLGMGLLAVGLLVGLFYMSKE